MKRKFLISEWVFQILVTVVGVLYTLYDYTHSVEFTELFIALFFVGVANLAGFIVRISLIASKFHRYYFFGVIVFFIALFAIFKLDSEMVFLPYFIGIGGGLFNIYYLAYGFYLIKNDQNHKVHH